MNSSAIKMKSVNIDYIRVDVQSVDFMTMCVWVRGTHIGVLFIKCMSSIQNKREGHDLADGILMA